jgi:hypothetical protein
MTGQEYELPLRDMKTDVGQSKGTRLKRFEDLLEADHESIKLIEL